MFKKYLILFFSIFLFISRAISQGKHEIVVNSINAFGGMEIINKIKTWKKVYTVKEVKLLNSEMYDSSIQIGKDTSLMITTIIQQKGCCERTDFKHIRKNRSHNIFVIHNGEERINGINDDFVREYESYDKNQSLFFDIPMGYLLFENYKIIDSASINGEKCKILKISGEDDFEIWISETDFLIKRIITKNKNGNFYATRNFYNYTNFNGLLLPKKIVKETIMDNQKTVTISELTDFEYNIYFPKSIFFFN
jgi:hypothetical protein